ncbi:YdcF family protein [Evansella sp. AB-rgal1]|uniref:YdcF family protein n=1 Tax=Evansella sp. AB-rgal1 TaxID=3242696 RepID=UPI00359EDC32
MTKYLYSFFILLAVLLLGIFGRSIGVLFIVANLAILSIILFFTQRRNKFVTRILAGGYLLFLLSFFIVQGLILYEVERSKAAPLENIDVVVILGAGLQGDRLSQTLESRLEKGVEYLLENEDVPVIVSGGQGPGETITEAEAMGRYLLEYGIREERIYYESRATTTYENITYSEEIMVELGFHEPTVLVVTSDYHALRAKMIANKVGIHSYSSSGESPLFVRINYLIREYFGVLKTMFYHNGEGIKKTEIQ